MAACQVQCRSAVCLQNLIVNACPILHNQSLHCGKIHVERRLSIIA